MTSMKPYASDLSDREWAILEPFIPPAKTGGRPRSVEMRQILNGVFYLLRSGCAWRLLAHNYPAWSTVYDYFRKWRNQGIWEQMVRTLRERLRVQDGRQATPSAAIIDSQSVKTTERGGPHGYDGGKKLSGRKRHLLVATMGWLLKEVVHSATLQDREGVPFLLEPIKGQFPRIEKVWVDNGYTGTGRTWIKEHMGWEVEVVIPTCVPSGIIGETMKEGKKTCFGNQSHTSHCSFSSGRSQTSHENGSTLLGSRTLGDHLSRLDEPS